jgi:hypothetical protein
VLRRRRSPPDPLAVVVPEVLGARWREPVAAALQARQRFLSAAAGALQGPVRDRLEELRAAIDAGVLATWEAARRAQALEQAAAELDLERITAQHKAMQRELAAGGDADEVALARAAALAERHTATQRIVNAVEDAEAELVGLEARLEALSVRALELVLTSTAGASGDIDQLDAVIVELRSVGEALSELG